MVERNGIPPRGAVRVLCAADEGLLPVVERQIFHPGDAMHLPRASHFQVIVPDPVERQKYLLRRTYSAAASMHQQMP